MGTTLHEAGIVWVQDLAASTATTVFPSGATAGVAPPNPGRHGNRIHVKLEYTVASGTMSTMVGVYGYTGNGAVPAVPNWVYLKSLNAGSSIVTDTSKWSSGATSIFMAEAFEISGENYSRFATRVYAPGGTTPVLSTYIGFIPD